MITDQSRGGKCAQIITRKYNSGSILAQPISRENMLHSIEHVNSYLLSVAVLIEL